MENGDIRDNQITASSEWGTEERAINGRLNLHAQVGRAGAWSSRQNNLDQWLQVDFQRSRLIAGISTQGRNNHNQFVKRYTVSSSQDGKTFQVYTHGGTVKVLFSILLNYKRKQKVDWQRL